MPVDGLWITFFTLFRISACEFTPICFCTAMAFMPGVLFLKMEGRIAGFQWRPGRQFAIIQLWRRFDFSACGRKRNAAKAERGFQPAWLRRRVF